MQSILLHYSSFYWICFYSIILFFYSKYLFRKFHWSLAVAISYTLIQTLCFMEWTDWAEPYSAPVNMVLRINQSTALIILLFSVFILEHIRPNPRHLAYLCMLNMAITILCIPVHFQKNWLIGMSMNPAMNGAITAITLPFLFSITAVYIFPVMLTAIALIFLSHSTTPVLAFIVSIFGPAFIHSGHKIRWSFITAILVLVMVWLIPDFSNACDRLDNWQFFGKYWWHNFNPLIGSGNGSFQVWGPLAQKLETISSDNFLTSFLPKLGNHFKDYHGPTRWYWLWLHSDIYQTLFELGVIGFVLWANAVIRFLYRIRKNEMLLGGALAWLLTATLYYPLHFPVQMFLGIFILSFSARRE